MTSKAWLWFWINGSKFLADWLWSCIALQFAVSLYEKNVDRLNLKWLWSLHLPVNWRRYLKNKYAIVKRCTRVLTHQLTWKRIGCKLISSLRTESELVVRLRYAAISSETSFTDWLEKDIRRFISEGSDGLKDDWLPCDWRSIIRLGAITVQTPSRLILL